MFRQINCIAISLDSRTVTFTKIMPKMRGIRHLQFLREISAVT